MLVFVFHRARVATVSFTAIAVFLAGMVLGGSPAHAETSYQQFLNLPLINRDAAHGPGGVNPALPTDLGELQRLVGQARASKAAPRSIAALLFQYRLVEATSRAGIDLARWDPRAGVQANRANLIKSYRFYEDLQLSHRELQWAGMGGQVGADFGGGLIDFELMSNIYGFGQLQDTSRAIVGKVNEAAGPQATAGLPAGLRALAAVGATVTSGDLHYILGMILVMQKNIFADLMPMHQAYVTEGLPALREMRDAGLFGNDVLRAWEDVASRNGDRIAKGNGVLLRREQGQVIKDQWDHVRAYKGEVGQAITYASTLAGSPSVANVLPPRSFRPIKLTSRLADGRTATVTTPLPDWNWSEFGPRWDYITAELLPKYKFEVEHNWPALEAVLRTPYEVQLESHRPLLTVPATLNSALQNTKVTVA